MDFKVYNESTIFDAKIVIIALHSGLRCFDGVGWAAGSGFY